MKYQQLLMVELVVVMVVVTWPMTMGKMEACSTGNRCSFVSLEVMTWRNASGIRHVKTDITFPHEKKQNISEVKQYISLETRRDDILMSSLLVVPEPQQNPIGYKLAPGIGWYRLHLDPLTWLEAGMACESEGAHLAVVNSQKEADVLKQILSRAPSSIPHATYSDVALIGFYDVEEGQYLTIFGQSLQEAGYTIWAPGQPNNLQGKNGEIDSDCGGIERNGKLNDLPCMSPYAYFCEYPL